MDKQLKYSIIAGIFLLVGATYWYVYNYSYNIHAASYRTFVVNGEGKVNAIPNVFIFNVGLINEGTDLSNLQRENSEKMNKIINYFKNEGVESKDIETIQYNLSPKYDKDGKNIIGYRIEQTVSVKVRNLEKVSKLLKGAIENGANYVNNLNFTFDDEIKLKLENEAREKAIKEAKEKALAIAKSAGFKLGRLVTVYEFTPPFYEIPPVKSIGFGGEGGIMGLPEPKVEPGSKEIKVQINLTYEIK